MATAKIIKLGNGNVTYIPITATNASQHYVGGSGSNAYVLLESYLNTLKGDVDQNANNIRVLAEATLSAYTKISDYENSYVKPVSGHSDQIMVYLPTTGTNKYQNTITIDNVAHATNAQKLTTGKLTYNGGNGTLTYSFGDSDKTITILGNETSYGFVKLDSTPTAGSKNGVTSAGLYTALAGKSATDHQHELAWSTTEKIDNAGTEINALVAVPSSDTTLGNSKQTAQFTTYTLPTKKYVDDAVSGAFADVASALKYQSTVNSNADLPSDPTKGDVYVVATAGQYAGKACEVGDYLIWDGSKWDALNGENQVENYNVTAKVNGSAVNIAQVDGTYITVQVSQDDDVVYDSDLTSYVNALNNGVGSGVVTGAYLTTNNGGQKLNLSYTQLSASGSYVSNATDITFVNSISQSANGAVSYTTKKISTMTGATSSADGAAGLVPAPYQTDTVRVLGSDGNWKTVSVQTPKLTHDVTPNLKYQVGGDIELGDIFGSFTDGPDIVTIADHDPATATVTLG